MTNNFYIRKRRKIVNGVQLTLMEKVSLGARPPLSHADLSGLDRNDHPQYALTADTAEILAQLATQNEAIIAELQTKLTTGELELPAIREAAEQIVNDTVQEVAGDATALQGISITDVSPAPDNILVYEPFTNTLVWRDLADLVATATVNIEGVDTNDFAVLEARVDHIEANYAIQYSSVSFTTIDATSDITSTGNIQTDATFIGGSLLLNRDASLSQSIIYFQDPNVGGLAFLDYTFAFDSDYWFRLSQRLTVDGTLSATSDIWCGATNVSEWVHELKQVQELTNEPSGFVNKDEVYMSADTAAGTFTIWPTGSSFQFYTQGELFTVSTPQTVAWERPTTETGSNFFYFEQGTGTLTSSTEFNLSLIVSDAYVANLYWNADQQRLVTFGDERHGCTMDNATHIYLHITEGTRFQEGLAIDVVTTEGTGDDVGDISFSVADGTIRDEDILLAIESTPSGQTRHHLAKSGATGNWVIDYSPYVALTAFTGVFTGTGRALYNNFNGTDWEVVEAGNNTYGLTHVFASNAYNSGSTGGNSGGTTGQILLIMGEGSYNTVNDARLAAADEIANIATAGLPFEEYVTIGTIIWQTANAYTNAAGARIRLTDLGNEYVDFRIAELTPGNSPGNHSQLTNLANDDHLQYFNDIRLTSTTHSQLAADVLCATTTIYSGGVDLATLISAGGGVSDHGALTGLLDDDHPQYTLTSTTLTLSGDFNAHTADTSIHFTEASIDHGSISGLLDNDHPQYALTGADVTFRTVTLTGGQLFLSCGATNGNQTIYFTDAGSPTDEYFQWQDTADRFYVSNDFYVNGSVDATAYLSGGSALGTIFAPAVLETEFDAHTADTLIHFTEASIDHGSISGLLDNDHPQYALLYANVIFDNITATSITTTGTSMHTTHLEAIDYVSGNVLCAVTQIYCGSSSLQALLDEVQSSSGAQIGESAYFTDLTGNSLFSLGNIYVNYNGPDADSYLYFYDGSSPTGRYFRWDNTDARFEVNAPLSASTILGDTVKASSYVGFEHDSNTNIVISGTAGGWYRLGTIADRGGVRVIISTTGGNYVPTTFIIDAYKNWTDVATLRLEKYGNTNHINDVRIITEGGVYYLDINVTADPDGLQARVYVQKMLGYDSTWTIYTDTLEEIVSTTGTTAALASFVPSQAGVTVENLRTEEAAVIGATLTVSGDVNIVDDSIRLNYTGPDADSFIYFYEGGNAFGRSLKWDNADNRFEFNDELYVNGNITSNGVVYALASLRSDASIYLNYAGPDANSYVYFYDAGSPTSRWLRWYDAGTRFWLNGPLQINDGVSASTGGIHILDDRDAEQPPSAFDRLVAWEFKRRSVVNAGGAGTYGALETIAPWSDDSGGPRYQQFHNEGGFFWRTGFETTDVWNDWEQVVFTGTDVQFGALTGSNLYSNANIFLDADGGDGDSFIFFYEGGSQTGRHLKWDDANNRFQFNDTLVVEGAVAAYSQLYVNYDGPDGDAYIYFYEGSDPSGRYLRWDDSEARFNFNDDLYVAGTLSAASFVYTNRIVVDSGSTTGWMVIDPSSSDGLGISFRADDNIGGWARGYNFSTGSTSNDQIGGFGALGSLKDLTYLWIGQNYNNSDIRTDANGHVGIGLNQSPPTNYALAVGSDGLRVLGASLFEDDTTVAGTLSAQTSISAGTDMYIAGDPVARSIDIQEFTSSGTWTKPAGAKYVEAYIWAGGGGGGGGAVGSSRSGGSGGAGAMFQHGKWNADDLSASETVTVGAGGTAGTAGGSSGGNGGTGGLSQFSELRVVGASGGLGGTTVDRAGGAINIAVDPRVGPAIGIPGSGGSSTVSSIGANGIRHTTAGGGGGAGGSHDNSSSSFAGGQGGSILSGGTSIHGGVATNPQSYSTLTFGGDGGPGGDGGFNTAAAAGTDGAFPGGGGGGGGTANTGFAAGAGGAGGAGYVVIITYF